MSNMDERRLFGRRRRANVPVEQKRTKRYEVSVSPQEDQILRSRAAVLQVTVPCLLFEAGMSDANASARPAIDTEWKTVAADLFELRRLMGNVANNVNQLARFANENGQFPQEAGAVVDEYRRLVARIDEAVRTVAGL